MLIPLLLACGTSGPPAALRPSSVPEAAIPVQYTGEKLLFGDKDVGTSRALAQDDPSRPHEALMEAMRGKGDIWVGLPANATWSEVRRVVHSAFEVGAGPVWLGASTGGQGIGPLDNTSPTVSIMDCPDGPLPITGATTRLTLEVQRFKGQRWIAPTANFLPMVRTPGGAPVPAQLLPPTCWQPVPCSVLGDPIEVESCSLTLGVHATAPGRTLLGGEKGCLLTPATEAPAWSAELPGALQRFGMDASTQVLLMADEPIPYADVLVALEGLHTAGIRPQLGLLNMGSGEQDPPCDAPVRDQDALKRARGAWFGAQLATRDEESR